MPLPPHTCRCAGETHEHTWRAGPTHWNVSSTCFYFCAAHAFSLSCCVLGSVHLHTGPPLTLRGLQAAPPSGPPSTLRPGDTDLPLIAVDLLLPRHFGEVSLHTGVRLPQKQHLERRAAILNRDACGQAAAQKGQPCEQAGGRPKTSPGLSRAGLRPAA